MIALPLLLLGAVTAALYADPAGAASALRHLYLLPVTWAALAAGGVGGGLAGLLAGLLLAPLALPAVERLGLEPRTLDGLVAVVTPLAFGVVVGRLVDEARARGARLEAVLAVQRALAGAGPLEERLGAAAEGARRALRAERVGLVVGSAEDGWLVARAPRGAAFDPGSAAGWVIRTGKPVAVTDLDGDGRLGRPSPARSRPVRGLVLPLPSAGGGALGALAIERDGDLPASLRQTAEALALHLALAVDNARLALRQRRFAQELEEKIIAATERLRQLDRAKSEFLSVVSHELRTPLTALQGFSELLLARRPPPERAERYLRHLHAESARLGRIVGDLLDLSRIESGQPPALRPEPVDLNELVERNLELFAPAHPRHRFEWAPAPDGALAADRDALDRVLKNLLSNAVKYSPEGGPITIRAGAAADRPGMVELSVRDEGIGIAAEDLPRIWDRYVRLPAAGAARGLGLGLCLVKALAEAHGGHVEVESTPGRGSCFRVLLPARKEQF